MPRGKSGVESRYRSKRFPERTVARRLQALAEKLFFKNIV